MHQQFALTGLFSLATSACLRIRACDRPKAVCITVQIYSSCHGFIERPGKTKAKTAQRKTEHKQAVLPGVVYCPQCPRKAVQPQLLPSVGRRWILGLILAGRVGKTNVLCSVSTLLSHLRRKTSTPQSLPPFFSCDSHIH